MDGVEGWMENEGGRVARGGGVARLRDLKRNRKYEKDLRKIAQDVRTVEKERNGMG